MNQIYVALAALAGGIATALMGWLECSDTFNPRKFGGSVIRAMIAGVVFAGGYDLAGRGVEALDFLYAFLGGAGADVLGNRIAGKLGNGSFPLSSSKPPPDQGDAPNTGGG